jgi:hypothetical protein
MEETMIGTKTLLGISLISLCGSCYGMENYNSGGLDSSVGTNLNSSITRNIGTNPTGSSTRQSAPTARPNTNSSVFVSINQTSGVGSSSSSTGSVAGPGSSTGSVAGPGPSIDVVEYNGKKKNVVTKEISGPKRTVILRTLDDLKNNPTMKELAAFGGIVQIPISHDEVHNASTNLKLGFALSLAQNGERDGNRAIVELKIVKIVEDYVNTNDLPAMTKLEEHDEIIVPSGELENLMEALNLEKVYVWMDFMWGCAPVDLAIKERK